MKKQKLTSKQIAAIAIEKETAYSKIDYSALGAYEKCCYLLEHACGFHPTVGPNRHNQEMMEALIPELRKKYEGGEVNAGLFLSLALSRFTEKRDEARELLCKEVEAGNPYAALSYLRQVKPTKEDKRLAEKVMNFFSQSADEKLLCIVNILCAYVIGLFAEKEELEELNRLVSDSWEKLALGGYFYAIDNVILHKKRALQAAKGECPALQEEYEAWVEARFLILEHFYHAGYFHLGEKLAYHYYKGMGCAQDNTKAVDALCRALLCRKAALKPGTVILTDAKREELAQKGKLVAIDILDALEKGEEALRATVRKAVAEGYISKACSAITVLRQAASA